MNTSLRKKKVFFWKKVECSFSDHWRNIDQLKVNVQDISYNQMHFWAGSILRFHNYRVSLFLLLSVFVNKRTDPCGNIVEKNWYRSYDLRLSVFEKGHFRIWWYILALLYISQALFQFRMIIKVKVFPAQIGGVKSPVLI